VRRQRRRVALALHEEQVALRRFGARDDAAVVLEHRALRLAKTAV